MAHARPENTYIEIWPCLRPLYSLSNLFESLSRLLQEIMYSLAPPLRVTLGDLIRQPGDI